MKTISSFTKLSTKDRLDSYFFISVVSESTLFDVAEKTDPRYIHAPSLQPDRTDQRERDVFEFGYSHVAFLLLDAILLVYRFSHMYVSGQVIAKCLNQQTNKRFPFPNQDDKSAQCKNKDLTNYNNWSAVNTELNTTTSNFANGENLYYSDCEHTSSHCTLAEEEEKELRVVDVNSSTGGTRSATCASIEVIISQLLRSSTISKVVVIPVCTIFLYLLVNSMLSVLDVDTLTDIFGTRVDTISLRINQTNSFLKSEADYLNEVTLDFYKNQMFLEMLDLQGFIAYFTAG